jgi:hypothetical protein
MRFIPTSADGPLHPELRGRARFRFRVALGGLESEVRKLRFHVRRVDGEYACTVTLTLESGEQLSVETRGAGFEEVLAFVARRAASAVHLRLSTNRLLGS